MPWRLGFYVAFETRWSRKRELFVFNWVWHLCRFPIYEASSHFVFISSSQSPLVLTLLRSSRVLINEKTSKFKWIVITDRPIYFNFNFWSEAIFQSRSAVIGLCFFLINSGYQFQGFVLIFFQWLQEVFEHNQLKFVYSCSWKYSNNLPICS